MRDHTKCREAGTKCSQHDPPSQVCLDSGPVCVHEGQMEISQLESIHPLDPRPYLDCHKGGE